MAGHRFWSQIATAVALCILSLACTDTFSRKTDKTVATASNAGANIVYGDLILPDNSEYVLIPVGFPLETSKFRGKGDFGTNFYYESGRGGNLLAYNIMFHHKKKNETHLLLKKNSLINSFQFINDDTDKGKPKNKYLFFELMPEDSNGDGSIDRQDAIVGYLADISGRNIKQITPNNTKIINWHLDKKLGFMLVKIQKDSDNDKEFSEKDETSFIRISLASPAIGNEIVNESVRQQINKRLAE